MFRYFSGLVLSISSRKRQWWMFSLVCLAVLPLFACVEKQIIPLTEPVVTVQPAVLNPVKSVVVAPKVNRYASLENFRVTQLKVSEARALAASLQPDRQGLQSWREMRFSLEQSLEYVRLKPENEQAVSLPSRPQVSVTWGELRGSILRMLEILPYLDENPGLLAEEFRWLALSPEFGFTGYYEPTLNASYRPSPMYSFPLYSRPPDLQPDKLFYDRHMIDRGRVLAGRGLELAWVRDELDAYFLQIQGSGRLIFPDGQSKHILFAGKNGHQYVSMGAILRDKGLLDANNISMPTIKSCLLGHPMEKTDLLDMNPSYVFFRLDDRGPVGSMGRILSPRVSLAVDPSVLPYGSLVFFNTMLPNQLGQHNRPLHALALPQDSGGAIRGRRIDIFFGAGKAAEHTAGHLNQGGRVYLLLPVKAGSFTYKSSSR